MPSRSSRLVGLLFAGAALALGSVSSSACSSSDPGAAGDGADAGVLTTTACDQDTRKDVYAPGLTKTTASSLSVKVVDSVPAPPAKATNTLTLQLLDAAGQPLDGASLAVVPFMPDHGHGSAVKPSIAGQGGGVYEVTNLYYPMPGLWRVTVTITTPNAAAQDAVFSFCIEG